MKTITIDPSGINNFHNSEPINVRVSGEVVSAWGEDDEEIVFRISKGQARRIQNHFCGISGCSCPAGGVVVELNQERSEFGLRAKVDED